MLNITKQTQFPPHLKNSKTNPFPCNFFTPFLFREGGRGVRSKKCGEAGIRLSRALSRETLFIPSPADRDKLFLLFLAPVLYLRFALTCRFLVGALLLIDQNYRPALRSICRAFSLVMLLDSFIQLIGYSCIQGLVLAAHQIEKPRLFLHGHPIPRLRSV